MNVVFFGTPEFAKIILEQLIHTEYKPILVVTAPDAPVGRNQEMTSSPVKVLAHEHKIQILQPEKVDEIFWLSPYGRSLEGRQASSFKPDLIIVAAYGHILPKEILNLPKYGALNVHPSLLPRWRGSSPIQYAILSGDQETGVTIIKMDKEIDHGPIVANVKCQMTNDKTTELLTVELAEIGGKLLLEVIPKWVAQEIKPIPQIEEDATYSRIIMKKDGCINWAKKASEIERQIRAFTPWPGSFTFWRNRRIEIISGTVAEFSSLKQMFPGQTFLYSREKLGVQTGKNIFVIEKLQLEGKNKTAIKEFLNGYAEVIGTTLN